MTMSRSSSNLDALAPRFDEYGDNPEVVALFRGEDDLLDGDGEYDGDGCDRLEIRDGVLWAAIDGTSDDCVAEILQGCQSCSERNPDLSYMMVGARPVDDDEIQRYDVLFLKGFDTATNPMKAKHGKFYDDYVVRGI